MDNKKQKKAMKKATEKTTEKATELVFILDRSGSMSGLESDTIGGFNGMLQKQKKETGIANITTVLFDDQYELMHDRVSIDKVTSITDREYYVRGTTALFDAIGKTIHRMVHVQKQAMTEGVTQEVVFVIITDGMENASSEFRATQVKTLIEHQKSFYGWEFIFLGANIDAVEAAQQIGIEEDRAVNYHADAEGVKLNFSAISEAVSVLRSEKPLSKQWRKSIDRDYEQRSRKK